MLRPALPLLFLAHAFGTVVAAPAMGKRQNGPLLQALVYRDYTNVCSDGDCSDDLAAMLTNTPGYNINVTFVGPDQDQNITTALLSQSHIFAYPGGSDVDVAWKYLKPYAQDIRNFVSNGGRYIGLCLGAFLAGSSVVSFDDGPLLSLLPNNDTTDREIEQDGAEITGEQDAVIRVNWTWGVGPNAGQTVNNVWQFFQDGANINLQPGDPARILGRYASNGDIATAVTPFGKGWVGVSGTHLEADKTWYVNETFKNPQGIHLEYGYDLVASVLEGFPASALNNNASSAQATA